jgi:hypothetical protein
MAKPNRNTAADISAIPTRIAQGKDSLGDASRAQVDSIHLALDAVDTASLAQSYITDLHDIFSALAVLTEGNVEANGLARVGDSLAERYVVAFDGITHRLQASLDALRGGVQ